MTREELHQRPPTATDCAQDEFLASLGLTTRSQLEADGARADRRRNMCERRGSA